ncbi:MAG: hypothetical protein LC687_00545 [Actinobacteria bacterium]|nr:hypothetical protein [Actinomycetota bacterium]MCA1806356.1 hypothetical protein [Actinomycetota bacterium]
MTIHTTGYHSHIQPPEPVEAYMYPLHLITEVEQQCPDCEATFVPKYTYDEEVTDHNGPLRRDTIDFYTDCPHCGESGVYSYHYYYD